MTKPDLLLALIMADVISYISNFHIPHTVIHVRL